MSARETKWEKEKPVSLQRGMFVITQLFRFRQAPVQNDGIFAQGFLQINQA